MNNDLISREALRETIDKITWYHINPHGELSEGAHGDSDALFKAEDIFKAIDNASTVDIKDEIAGAYNEGYMCGNKEAEKARPKGEWAEPMRTKWNEIQAGLLICPFCGATPHKQYKNFCPNCGADMRKGNAEQ